MRIRKSSREEAAVRRLAEAHVGLVFHWAGLCKRRKLYQEIDLNEMVQEGYFGLIKAAQKYDPGKGQFSTYATRWIRKFIRKFRLRSQGPGCVPCDSRRIDNRDILDAEAASSVMEDHALDSAVASETASAIASSLGDLDDRSRDIVAARFGIFGRTATYRELAERHGVCVERIRQIEKKALEKMRKSKILTHLKS